MEERLRIRDLLLAPEAWWITTTGCLPRQVSSAATLEYFTRHLNPEQRAGAAPEERGHFCAPARPAALAQYPETTPLQTLLIPVEYKFLAGRVERWGQPAAALAGLAAIDARRDAGCGAGFCGAASGGVAALAAQRGAALLDSDRQRRRPTFWRAAAPRGICAALRAWLTERAGCPSTCSNSTAAVPAYLTPQLVVVHEGRELARGTDLEELREQCAVGGTR